jgi:FKBP-type peptidyl-prolyl cis-trans isomerase
LEIFRLNSQKDKIDDAERRLSTCRGAKPKGVGLKNQRLFLLACLVAVIFVVWGMDQAVHAQSQPDVRPQSEQGGQTAPDRPDEAPVLKTQKDQVNYAVGVNLIGNFKRQGVEIDLNLVIKGMQDAYAGKGLLMPDAEVRRALTIYQAEVRRMQTKIRTIKAEENRKEGEAFLEENRKKEGVITLPSGLQYRIIKAGEGEKPTDIDSVECHYRGTLINGSEFDSSYRKGTPATLKVKDVIPGWAEALKLMPVGSKWQIFVPSQLAYGERGAGVSIGPNATLIFEIEILAIK